MNLPTLYDFTNFWLTQSELSFCESFPAKKIVLTRSYGQCLESISQWVVLYFRKRWVPDSEGDPGVSGDRLRKKVCGDQTAKGLTCWNWISVTGSGSRHCHGLPSPILLLFPKSLTPGLREINAQPLSCLRFDGSDVGGSAEFQVYLIPWLLLHSLLFWFPCSNDDSINKRIDL